MSVSSIKPSGYLKAAPRGQSYIETVTSVLNDPLDLVVSSGSMPTGLVFDNTTGDFTGIPTVGGNFTFTIVNNGDYGAQVFDNGVSATFTILVSSIVVSTDAILPSIVGTGINNADIVARVQKTICCLADKADCLIENYDVGNDNSDTYLKQYAIADTMLEAIQNYTPQEVPATLNLMGILGSSFGTIDLYVGSIELALITYRTEWSTSLAEMAIDLTNAINANTNISGFTALRQGNIVTIYSPEGQAVTYNDVSPSLVVIGDVDLVSVGHNTFSGGIAGYTADKMTDNCLTETDVDNMFQYLSKWCGVCYAPYGSTYTISQSGVEFISQENGKAILTEDGDYIIT